MKKDNILRPLVLGVISFLLVTMSFFHIFFSPYSKEYLDHKQTFSQTLKDRDSITLNMIEKHHELIKDYNLNSKEYDLLTNYKDHYDLYTKKVVEYNSVKKKLVHKHSFRGRPSFHLWIFLFGLVSALMFFSCKSLFNDIVNGSTYRFQFISLTGIAVSFFWMIHLIFLTQKDFTKNSYILMILSCACLATFFTYFLVKNYTYKDDIILKQLSLIDKIKTIHYPRVALKALYAERNDKAMLATDTVRENADAFDHDILTTLKDV